MIDLGTCPMNRETTIAAEQLDYFDNINDLENVAELEQLHGITVAAARQALKLYDAAWPLLSESHPVPDMPAQPDTEYWEKMASMLRRLSPKGLESFLAIMPDDEITRPLRALLVPYPADWPPADWPVECVWCAEAPATICPPRIAPPLFGFALCAACHAACPDDELGLFPLLNTVEVV